MPNFTPDLTKVQSNFTLFQKGEYEFIVGEPTAFVREKKDASGNPTGASSYGVRFPLSTPDGAAVKGRQMYSAYLDSEGGQQFAKRFVMAVLGFSGDTGEKEFDKQFAGADWSINTDTKAVGDLWRQCSGRRVNASLDVGENPNTHEPSQQFAGFRPMAAAA